MAKRIKKDVEKRISYLTKELDESIKIESEEKARGLIEKYGPLIRTYPIWHPFSSEDQNCKNEFESNFEYGFVDLDHFTKLKNAIINCPYDHVNPLNLINHIKKMSINKNKEIIIGSELDFKLYDMSVCPVLITYKDLNKDIYSQNKILKLWEKIIYEHESGCLPLYRFREWEDFQDLFLGTPNNGKRSAFVTPKTVEKMKEIWEFKKERDIYIEKCDECCHEMSKCHCEICENCDEKNFKCECDS